MAHTPLAFDEPNDHARFRIAGDDLISPFAALAKARVAPDIEARLPAIVSVAAGAMEREDGRNLFPVTDVVGGMGL